MLRFALRKIECPFSPVSCPLFPVSWLPPPGLRPRSANLNPVRQSRDLLSRQPQLGRHLIKLAVIHGIDQQALRRFARYNRRPGIATLQRRRARIESQSTLELLSPVTVALKQPRHTNRPHAL